MDVGSLQPSRGALEAACRWLRTTAMFRPKIPEVLAAVREAGIIYEKALRALDELPGQIARAEHAWKQSEKEGDDEPVEIRGWNFYNPRGVRFWLQHVPTAVNRDSQDTLEVRV
jgi:hypothetical protein